MPDVARETRDHPPKRLMGYYDICQTPLFLAANGKRPVHLTYDFSLRQYYLPFNLHAITQNPLNFFQNFSTNCRLPKLLDGVKYCQKVQL